VSYEERSGALSSVVIMNMFWTDDLLKKKFPKKFETDIPIPAVLVWTPSIRVYNTITEDTTLKTGETRFRKILLYPNGTMHYSVMGLTTTKCEASVFYYPMDQQRCEIIFLGDEPVQKIELKPLILESTEVNIGSALIKNEEWEIRNVKFKVEQFYSEQGVTLSFSISRRPLYLMMNFVVPLAYLCLLNVFVFLLPESSGERMSYAVTILLCLILYLNMIADRLPTSDPISLLNIYIVIQFNSSCFVVLMNILILWMYDQQQRNQPVTDFWQMFMCVLDHKYWRRGKMNVQAEKIDSEETDDKMADRKPDKESNITWCHVSQSANRCLFCLTFLFFSIQVLIFLVLLVVHYKSD
jgi:hypothetical protein